MTENIISPTHGKATLTIVAPKSREVAKLVPIKKTREKPAILLPPQQEKYIKARKHDFL